jgi:RNA polymerase sigma-70 factor (ECF subfamily)
MNFWEIYDQFYAKVRRFILALVKDEWVADDLIQETLTRVQENLDSLRDPSKVSSWIFRIAYNLCQDHFRQSRIRWNEAKTGHEGSFSASSLQKEVEQHEMGQCVQDRVNLLPEPLRTVLVLYDIMEFSHQEIAEIIGITPQNAKVRLNRARARLRIILKEQCVFEKDERNVLVCEPVNILKQKMKK